MRFFLATFAIALCTLSSANAGIVLIDDFNDNSPNNVVLQPTLPIPPGPRVGVNTGSFSFPATDDATIIGGSRQVSSALFTDEGQLFAGTTGNGAGPETFTHAGAPNSRAISYTIWDGQDGGGSDTFDTGVGMIPIDFDGLGGADLTAGEAAVLEFGAVFNDLGGEITFILWDADDPTGATFVENTFTLAPGVTGLFSESYSNFSHSSGGDPLDVFDSVGSILMVIDGNLSSGFGVGASQANFGWDVEIDFIQGRMVIPEPTSVTLLSVFAAGLTLGRRRRS